MSGQGSVLTEGRYMQTEIGEGRTSPIEFSRALSNKKRYQILQMLSREPMSVEDIAGRLALKQAAIRHHIRMLVRSSLIEEVGEKQLKIGRPITLYRAVRRPVSVEFPQRQYYLLADVLIQALTESIPLAKLAKVLRQIGYRIGENTVKDLTYHYGIRRWDIATLKKYLVDGYLLETGAQPEVVRADDKEIIFKLHNCVFFELSKRYPETVCNGFDQGIRDGVVERTLGSGEHIRTKCQATGDEYCEFTFRVKQPEMER